MANYPNYGLNLSNYINVLFTAHLFKSNHTCNWAIIIKSTAGISCTKNIFYKALYKLFLLFIPFYDQYLEYFYLTFYLYLNNSALASLSHWRLFLASVAFMNLFVCMDAIYETSCI